MQIAIDYIYTVKTAIFSAIYTSLLIANNGNYLLLGIVVHYKIVCNNNILNVNNNLNSSY